MEGAESTILSLKNDLLMIFTCVSVSFYCFLYFVGFIASKSYP